MTRSHGIAGLAWLALAALQGCATSPRFDAQFGSAVRANLAAQTLHPDAARNRNPVRGIDGAAARAAQERYERSFAQPDARQDQPLVNGQGSR